jgi:hypothetical protein
MPVQNLPVFRRCGHFLQRRQMLVNGYRIYPASLFRGGQWFDHQHVQDRRVLGQVSQHRPSEHHLG